MVVAGDAPPCWGRPRAVAAVGSGTGQPHHLVCPSLADLTEVLDAVDTCVAQANADYQQELDLQRASAAQLQTDKDDRDQYLENVRHVIDERYDGEGDATLIAAHG